MNDYNEIFNRLQNAMQTSQDHVMSQIAQNEIANKALEREKADLGQISKEARLLGLVQGVAAEFEHVHRRLTEAMRQIAPSAEQMAPTTDQAAGNSSNQQS